MTDVCSVVAQLKLTPKGKLQYGREFNEIDLLTEFSKLCLSPQAFKNGAKITEVNECGASAEEKSPERYSNYFTPQKAKKSTQQQQQQQQQQHVCSPIKGLCSPKNECSNKKEAIDKEESFNFIKPYDNSQMYLRGIDEEYRDRSKEMGNARLHDYYARILKFDSEHATSMESIERSSLVKQNEEAKQINEDQNRASDELTYYQGLMEQRESLAAEKLRQAEIHRKEIEAKIKKDNDLKREKLEKKKTLANLAEPGLKILNSVTQLYVDKGKSNQCDEFKTIVDKVNQEYNNLVNIVHQGINSNYDVDVKIHEARDKLNTLNSLKTASEQLSRNIEENMKKIEESIKAKEAARETARKEAEEKMKKLAQEEKAKQSAEAPSTSTPGSTAAQPTPGSTAATVVPRVLENELSIAAAAPALLPVESMLKPMLQMFVPKSCFRDYLRLSKLVADTEKAHEALSKTTLKDKKTYKFDLYKVINTTINAISDESPKHLMDKVTRLVTLLSGKDVVNAGKRVSTNSDPAALILSKDLIAKKLVLQGPTQVASSHKAAFAIAAVALGVWGAFPDVGELLLGHFYTKCPYVVPFYIPKSKEMSTPDYCKLVGYSVDGEEVESEDKFLKKLSGIIRLYAAIISSDIPPALGKLNHPHGLDHAWSWLTRVLNMEPRPVTATIVFDFLEVAGHAMMKRFGAQFRKMLLVLCEDVMPKILEVTPNESKAGAMRLKIFLENCIKEGRVKEPEGCLSKNWYTSSYYR